MSDTSNNKIMEEIEHKSILKIDEKSIKAKEFLNILTDMILNYSQKSKADKTA